MMYAMRDGGCGFGGADAEGAVIALRRISRMPCDTLSEFMASLATRAERQTGVPVRAQPAEALLSDLVEAGLIVRTM